MTLDSAVAVVWRWAYAPEVWRKLSRHGGDEDWVVVFHEEKVPFTLDSDYVAGWGHVDRHDIDDDNHVIIFAHS